MKVYSEKCEVETAKDKVWRDALIVRRCFGLSSSLNLSKYFFLGFVFGMVLNLWGSFGGRFYSSGGDLGVVLGVLLETLGRFWIILDPDRFQEPLGSIILTSFG